jgi:outer membrane usher protein
MGAVIGISIPLGGRTSASVSGNAGLGQNYGTAQITQSAAQIGEFGYQVSSTLGQVSRQFADAQYRSSDALFDIGVDRTSGQNSYRGSAQGALAFADGQLFAANTIYDSFAVVDTAGIAGIHVLQENRVVGTTSSSGTQLVTDLRSFETNRIDIDPRDVPMDASFTTPTQIVRPADRSGVVVKFALTQTHGALIVLVDKAGKPLPVGSHAVLESTHEAATVGFDGEAFITGLEEHNMLTVKRQDGSACTVRFDFTPHPGALPKLGPLPCVPAP